MEFFYTLVFSIHKIVVHNIIKNLNQNEYPSVSIQFLGAPGNNRI